MKAGALVPHLRVDEDVHSGFVGDFHQNGEDGGQPRTLVLDLQDDPVNQALPSSEGPS